MANADIDQLIEDVIEREWDYVDHPADRGGPTRWGLRKPWRGGRGIWMICAACRKAMLRRSTSILADPGFRQGRGNRAEARGRAV